MWKRIPNADRTLQAEQTYFWGLSDEDSPKYPDSDLDSANLKTKDRLKLVAETLEKWLGQFPDAGEPETDSLEKRKKAKFPDAGEPETDSLEKRKKAKFPDAREPETDSRLVSGC
jgi:hypothetical protein